MPNDTIRFMLAIPNDMAERAKILKKEIFYDKPYAEMYRQLIRLGLDHLQEKEILEKKHEKVK